MPFPSPHPGLVLHDAYLWHAEHKQGQEEGIKDRPCVIVLTAEGATTRYGALPRLGQSWSIRVAPGGPTGHKLKSTQTCDCWQGRTGVLKRKIPDACRTEA